jgi:enterochelin esterase-like enzyme
VAALAGSSDARSSVLRHAESLAQTDPLVARHLIEEALRTSGGPLIDYQEGEQGGTFTASFVAIGPAQAPVVRCPLFVTDEWQREMRAVPGVPSVWWAEASTPYGAISTQYRFLPRRIESVEFMTDDAHASIVATLRAVYELGYPDPFNSQREYPTSAAGMAARVPYEKWDSVIRFPGAATRVARPSAAQRDGTLESFVLPSARLGNARTITIWEPRGVDQRAPLPIVVLLDGDDMLHAIGAPGIFEDLAKDVREFRAVLVHNATEVSRLTEYPCSPAFVDFMVDELWPAVRARIAVAHPVDQRIVGGFSYGGLAALWLGLSRPDIFGGVLALSPSMWWGPDVQPSRLPEPVPDYVARGEWLTSAFAAADPVPLRVWLSVGLLEMRKLPNAPHLDMLSCCRRLRGVLEAKGYDVVGYLEHPSGHEFLGWREGLERGLRALLGQRGS